MDNYTTMASRCHPTDLLSDAVLTNKFTYIYFIPIIFLFTEPPASTPAIAVPAKNEQQPVEKPNVSGSDVRIIINSEM